MRRIICKIIIVFVPFEVAHAQQPVENTESTCSFTEIYRKDGWSIPGIKGAKKKDGRIAVPGKPGMYVTELEPTTHEARIQSISCSRERPGRLEVKDLDVGITNLTAFDVGGHIFAYNLMYGIDEIAAEWSVRFYDLDGSGRFTLMRSETNRLVPELIPDWVKDSAGAKAKEPRKNSFHFVWGQLR